MKKSREVTLYGRVFDFDDIKKKMDEFIFDDVWHMRINDPQKFLDTYLELHYEIKEEHFMLETAMKDTKLYDLDTLLEAIEQTCDLADDMSTINRKMFRSRLYQIFDIEDEVAAMKDEANRERMLCDKQEHCERGYDD